MWRSVALSWFLFASQTWAQQSWSSVFKQTSAAIATVRIKDEAGRVVGFASGFLLSDSSLVTNHHVLAGAVGASATFKDGRELEIDGILGDDGMHDVAIAHLKSPAAGVTPLRLSASLPEVGERICVIGNPRGELELSLTEGVISAIRSDYEGHGQVIQMTAATSPGNSGSPVLNASGEVVGVHCLSLSRLGFEGVKFAIPASRVSALPIGAIRPLSSVPKPSSDPVLSSFAPGIRRHLLPTPPQPPTNILSWVAEPQREQIQRLARYYIRLPDGACENAYRLLRPRELGNKGMHASQDELIALGLNSGPAGEVTHVAGTPGRWGSLGNTVLCGIGDTDLQNVETFSDGIAVATLGSKACIIVASSPDEKDLKALLSDALLLVPITEVPVEKNTVPVYQAFSLQQCIPTPEELAFAIQRGKGRLVIYTFLRNSIQHKHTESSGVQSFGLGGSRTVYDGPRETTITWHSVEPKVEFREPKEKTSEPDPNPVSKAPTPSAPDTLRMRDGRVLHGRVVSEDTTSVEFVVVVASVESTMRFARPDVLSIERGK